MVAGWVAVAESRVSLLPGSQPGLVLRVLAVQQGLPMALWVLFVVEVGIAMGQLLPAAAAAGAAAGAARGARAAAAAVASAAVAAVGTAAAAAVRQPWLLLHFLPCLLLLTVPCFLQCC